MPRFALLEHDTRPSPESAAPAEDDVHWDLLIERTGEPRLATWRVTPGDARASLTIERIADHRPRYLEYEGEISGGRGRVRRIDTGVVDILDWRPDRAMLDFDGRVLCGRYVLSPTTGTGTLAPAASDR